MLDLNIPDGAALHGKQIVLLIDLASVHHPADFLFQNTVQPDSGGAAIAFPERVCNVHFHIFFNNLVEIALRHLVDVLQRSVQIHERHKYTFLWNYVNNSIVLIQKQSF